jgi:hypothetical protein
VYGEDALIAEGKLNVEFAEEVAAEFDNKIYSKITGAFGGPATDFDKNGRVIILLLDIIEEDTTYGYTAGYFYYPDLYNYSNSNRAEMLYINYKYPGSNNFYSTMAHELQHLINCSLHLYGDEMDLWIDEGLASAAEYLYKGDHQQNDPNGRVSWFINDEQGTIREGNNFFIWDGSWENNGAKSDLLSNYATAYLFFQWLRIHASNDRRIYKDIIDSTYTDYQAVTEAAKKRIPAFSDISDNEAGWATLLGAWYAANRLRAESGIYGYEGEIALTFTWGWQGGYDHNVSLDPGEGVYSKISGSINNDSLTGTPTIRYLGLNTSGVPDESPPYNTTYLLTYNGSTGGNSVDGYTADPVPASVSRLRMAAGSGGTTESPEAILRRWDGGRVFLEKLRDSGMFPED